MSIMNAYAQALRPKVFRLPSAEDVGTAFGIGKQAALTPAGSARWLGLINNRQSAVDTARKMHVEPLVRTIQASGTPMVRKAVASHWPAMQAAQKQQAQLVRMSGKLTQRWPDELGQHAPAVRDTFHAAVAGSKEMQEQVGLARRSIMRRTGAA